MINAVVAVGIWVLILWVAYTVRLIRERRELKRRMVDTQRRLDRLSWETVRLPNGEYVRRKR